MKKLIIAALLSLAGIGLVTERASAWLFCRNCCTIRVKPYNAFSPSVFGSICADGCFPLCCPPPCCPPPCCCPPPPPCCCPPPCCFPPLGCPMDGCGCGACGMGPGPMMPPPFLAGPGPMMPPPPFLAGPGPMMAPPFLAGPGPMMGSPPMAGPAMFPPGGGFPNYQLTPGGNLPNFQPPPANVPNFQGPPPMPLPAGPALPMTGAVSYPTGIQTAGYGGFAPAGSYPGYAPTPWAQPAVYPSYWNMPSPSGR